MNAASEMISFDINWPFTITSDQKCKVLLRTVKVQMSLKCVKVHFKMTCATTFS